MGYTGEQKRVYQREWLKQRRTNWLQEHGPCIQCGSWEKLEIDHINRADKQCSINSLWSYTKERREAELKKCQVLCYDCHQVKTLDEKYSSYAKPSHGTITGYTAHHCRCDACRAAHNAYSREYRNRKNK